MFNSSPDERSRNDDDSTAGTDCAAEVDARRSPDGVVVGWRRQHFIAANVRWGFRARHTRIVRETTAHRLRRSRLFSMLSSSRSRTTSGTNSKRHRRAVDVALDIVEVACSTLSRVKENSTSKVVDEMVESIFCTQCSTTDNGEEKLILRMELSCRYISIPKTNMRKVTIFVWNLLEMVL